MKKEAMPELDDDKLDALMRGHVKRKLEPFVGLASPAVMRWNFNNPGQSAKGPWKKTAGVAAAACALGLILSAGGYLAFRSNQPPMAIADGPVTTVKWWENYDGGTIVGEDKTPARLIQRVQFEKTSRTLPDGSVKEETTVPNRDLLVVYYPTQ